MALAKIDQDFILDKLYECRGKIDFTNKEAIEKIDAIIDIIIHSTIIENQGMFPKIKISRG